MMGDQGQQEGWTPPGEDRPASSPRPGFLPPAPPPDPGAAPAEPPAAARSPSAGWGLARLLTATALLVSAFLPWAKAGVRLEGFGQVLHRELATEAGVNVDGTGQLVPVFAVAAIVMIGWSLLKGDLRIGALAAVPGALALISCLVFLLRLDRFREEIGVGRMFLGGLEVSAGYGWYLSVASSLLLIGLALARRGG
ncbi:MULTISPECIES: hypothetical protein [Thermomonospora]|uniref:Uncharacterized protein n=1 Tax=Thermomonospora curvata (strain ATCC 19995 / DSM 43183 / JCM 3096 / KCTC 9072 / NBRC 15933 / NCIMB 10081 / Henssen B9) TaxID=471852 RepID=D1A9U5_THECD|nr:MULTISPECIES: hypothetical protein [Thermomonospora]ACY98781.1 hypothetical protein Tcur_3242 [Thermomonospora curvata DSM 43183]PKK12993.1 MAG: hypothetical protein BUE48_015895 [Thermomonospora sp. CIF 1]